MQRFETLTEFATEDRIISLVAKERGKYTAKNGGSANPFRSDPLFIRLRELTPPHKLWSNPGRGKLPKKEDKGLGRWACRKKRASVRVYQAAKRHIGKEPSEPWKENLKEFIRDIQDTLSGKSALVLETPRILAKFKEQEGADFIFRPICKYSDLKTKIILALTYQYILAMFDRFFHKDMLFMRAARRTGRHKYSVPKFLDAIDMISGYRRKHGFDTIYVGECDIQKFYDIFNHDVIMECFEDLFEEAVKKYNVSGSDFDPLRNVIRSYLASFNFPEHVMGRNGDPGFWRGEVQRRRKGDGPDPVCRFKWVDEKAFVSSGCYSPEEFRAAVDGKKLGIPQGGALSGIIVNVVMRVVDKPVVGGEDPERLFIRYCDDIMLMHTDEECCRRYLDAYHESLVACKLIPHPRKNVSDFKSGKKTREGFWHSKSKNVYRWGSGSGDASDWVAFVGYEMRRTGQIRIRKDKVDAEFKRIARRYYDIICSNAARSGEPLSGTVQQDLMKRMDSLPAHILDYEKAGNNKYTLSQARRLDKYLYRKSRQAAARIGMAEPEKAAKQRATYRKCVSSLSRDV